MVLLLAYLSSPAPAQAQQPPPGFRTVTGSQGYQFQVPTDWYEPPIGALPVTVDADLVSPDGSQSVAAGVFPANGATAADLPQLAQVFAGGVALQQQATGGSAPVAFHGPEYIQVPNADAALGLVEVFSDRDGNAQVLGARLAIRDSYVYVLTLTVPESAYASDPAFDTILDSFQLAPSISLSPPA